MAGLQIGITAWGSDESPSSFLEHAQEADELGFHSIWLPESHFLERGSYPAPLMLLAAAAARTKNIRLGTTSYILPIREPLLVAEEVAVLDRISEGRVIFGIGRGFRSAMFRAFDVPVSEKRERFEAALQTIMRAWSGQTIDAEGETRVYPEPYQKPHPPIWVAAFGPKALQQAGRLGLPYLASPLESRDQLIKNYTEHAAARSNAGDSESLAIPVMRTVFVTDDSDLAKRVNSSLEAQARAIAGITRERPEPPMQHAAIVGTLSEVRTELDRYVLDLGMTHLIARTHVPGATPEELQRSVHLLATLH